MSNEPLLILLITLPFLSSLIAGFLPANARNAEAWLAGAVALAGTVLVATWYPDVADGGVVRYRAEWLPQLGIEFSLRMDGFAWLFAGLVSGIGLLVVLYARYYMSPEDPVPRFFSFLLAFMGAMLGLVLSGNLIQLVFFWELTSLFSFLLIGYWHHNAQARDGARTSLIVTGSGGLCLFAGVLLLGHIAGGYDLDTVLAAGDAIRGHALYLPTLVLILLGALSKSAQFPFHFWLPEAMAAPTPVSSYLHSATMVKAGVFLLVRLWPVLAGTDAWLWMVAGAGLCSLLLGAYAAMFQQDLKGLLAYSTISHLGLITLLLGLNSHLGAVAAIFHIMNHATFKASLFMAAGIIDHETGTRDLRRLRGLGKLMPITASLAMVASAAMAGVPLLNGFLSKEMFFSEALAATTPIPAVGEFLTYAATVAGVFSVVYSLRLIHGVFLRPATEPLPRVPHEPPRWMRFPVEFLVLLCLVVGVLPGHTVGGLLETAVFSVLGDATPHYDLALWHGFNLPLLMSVIALLGGVALYALLRFLIGDAVKGTPLLRHVPAKRMFDAVLTAVTWRFAHFLEDLLGTRRLQPQLELLVAVTFAVAALVIYDRGLHAGWMGTSAIDPVLLLVWVAGGACAVGAAHQAKFHRLVALILMGGAGLATCITYVWLSAPDLALTQLLVEVVTTVLILLGLRWLPKRIPEPEARPTPLERLRRLRDLAVAVVVGAGLSVLAYAVMTRPLPDTIASFFLEQAYSGGGGKNVVNVILVDFRGFDTLGEITVLGVVGLTVYALLRRFRPAPESIEIPRQQRLQNAEDEARGDRHKGDTVADYLLVPSMLMRLLFPVIGIFAIYLFLRGHNEPGGGFVAGLVLAVAIILQYMAGGTRWVETRLRIRAVRWMGLGLLCAVLTGAGAWLLGYPFLTSHTRYVELPLLGKLPLASATLFDLGVFLLVVGVTALVLLALAHQSIRSRLARGSADATADSAKAVLDAIKED